MKFTKEMTIREALDLDSRSAEIFQEFGMHCIACPEASGEPIEEAAIAHGIDVETLIEKLNKL